jgi:hypothetical protein
MNTLISSYLAASVLLVASSSWAQQISGNVRCSDTDPATPLAGLTVVATGFFGATQSAVTDADGHYSLNVPEDLYTITIPTLPSGVSIVNPENGSYLEFLTAGISVTANFGLTGCGSAPSGELGDWVWDDLNCDGVQDPEEPGMPGVTVQLAACDGSLLATTTTDNDGAYLFASLPAGDYFIQFILPPGYQFSPANPEGDSTKDSDADPLTGATPCISLADGQSDFSLDAGLCRLVAPGVRSQGFWKNHPEAWPVLEIEIGGVTYSVEEAILIMQLPSKGDKSLNMFEQLVAAKLNISAGNESSCIGDMIIATDLWMVMNPSPVAAKSAAWRKSGNHLLSELDAYNNGFLCAPSAE